MAFLSLVRGIKSDEFKISTRPEWSAPALEPAAPTIKKEHGNKDGNSCAHNNEDKVEGGNQMDQT